MKKFLLLHCGFETPTPEIMEKWKAWFATIADRSVENVGFAGGRQIDHDGTTELPWNIDSITGYSMIEAESLDEAETIAKTNPFVQSIRVYEVRAH